jgi:hypothetical protein
MAHTLTIANATYPDVPAIDVPISGGGTARFTDVSATTAAAEDVLEGKVFYDASGVQTVGTGSGGGGSKYGMSIDDFIGDVSSDTLQAPAGGNVDLVISGFSKMAQYVFYYKFARNLALRSVTFADVTEIKTTYALQYAFNACTNIKNVSFPKLTIIQASSGMANTFYGCSNLLTADFPLLETINTSSSCQYWFYNCTKLATISFPSLKTIGAATGTSANNRHLYYAFSGCNALTTIEFPALEAIYCNGTGASYGSFANNNKVQKLYFPKLHTIAKASNYTASNGDLGSQNTFYNCSALKEIHFAAENQAAIEASTGYATKWAAPSGCSILFDL